MADREVSEWALDALGVRRASLPIADRGPAALAQAAEVLGVDSAVLGPLLADAIVTGRAADANAGLVAFREGADRVVVLSAAPLRSEERLWAGVAHELGNALTTIAGWASLATSTLDETEARRAIAMVQESAREAMDVAPLLLEGSEGGETSEAARVVSSVVERLAPLAAARGVTLRVGQLDGGMVVSSRAAVTAITANLVKNAIEASRDGGRVEIRVVAAPRTVEIVVADHGRGMSESTQRMLFGARTARPEGSPRGRGVGLSVVHALVQRAHGKVRVTSTVGSGTSVFIQLVRKKSVQSSGVRKRAGARRVLVVEDSASIAELLGTALAARGATVFSTSRPEAALVEARRAPFDLALVDLDLGDTSGAGLTEALVRDGLATRVLVMSGAPSIDVPHAHGFLRKPFDLADLDEVLAEAPAPRRARPRAL